MDSTSLRILEKTPAKTNLISLICTLYTLSEENNVFKYVNLKNSIFFIITQKQISLVLGNLIFPK